ncbi:MAG: hypothetical protein AB1505_04015 [Candidatus Latescibacterota bacterium]
MSACSRWLVWAGVMLAPEMGAGGDPRVAGERPPRPAGGAAGGRVAKALVAAPVGEANLLTRDGWRPWEAGFAREGEVLVCDNGGDAGVQRGASQEVALHGTREPIVATAWSRAEGVGGTPDADYSLYLDLIYEDGTPLWGELALFSTGTHDWQRRQVVVLPSKPVRTLTVHLLLRRHAGRASFRDPELYVLRAPAGAALFDGVPVVVQAAPVAGFQVRDVAADSDFLQLEGQALGLELVAQSPVQDGVTFVDARLRDTTGGDRAVTLVYALPVPGATHWLADPRTATPLESGRQYGEASSCRAGMGRLSRYPLAAVAGPGGGTAMGIDMAHPAVFRVGYSAATGELYVAWDLGLTPEQPEAHVRCCWFPFAPEWGFRAALARYWEAFPEAFVCRIRQQGIWMPFAAISKVAGWEDFGFRFKEGNEETAWDDAHGILTFRYTEPMTWWMPMPKGMPRTLEAALGEAHRRAAEEGEKAAQALFASGYGNEEGQFPARLLDTPWCDGAVWSMNSMPGIPGAVTDFRLKWNPELQERFYGAGRSGDLDGEYVDSSEGYVTDELDFRRDHFGSAQTPLTFSVDSRRPALYRGLIAFEFVRAMASDVHAMGRLMMANATPLRLCWLAPLLDVMGTETDWNPGGRWQPMTDADLLYVRALCRGKPFCFLMNTDFDRFPKDLVERYMKRALAYGMFPGFFSHNAAEGHYFTRRDLYERDRPLFRKYVPLCRRVAEAAWEPVTNARADDPVVRLERFGTRYLTVLNDSPQARTVSVRLDGPAPAASVELVAGLPLVWTDGATQLRLGPEDVAVIDLQP